MSKPHPAALACAHRPLAGRREPRSAGPKLSRKRIRAFVASIFEDDLHAKRVESLGDGTTGVIHAAAASIHAIGQGLARATGCDAKHAIKQVDRLLGNTGLDMDRVFALWVAFVVGRVRKEIVVTFDWTDFDADDQTTIALNLVTSHGRATPLMWMTVRKSELKDRRNDYEDQLLERLERALPEWVKVTLLADRGFGDQKLYELLRLLGFEYVVRFRGVIRVEAPDGEARPAADWVPPGGRPQLIREARVTADRYPVPAVVCVKARGMKDPWLLASSRSDLTGAAIVKLYGRRFTTEESFRDTKNLRFGLGLSIVHTKSVQRRDRLLLLCALAEALLTLLGAAAEACGLDRTQKANTVRKRTYSLFRQGLYWYGAIPNMRRDDLRSLMNAFGAIVRQHPVFADVFGLI